MATTRLTRHTRAIADRIIAEVVVDEPLHAELLRQHQRLYRAMFDWICAKVHYADMDVLRHYKCTRNLDNFRVGVFTSQLDAAMQARGVEAVYAIPGAQGVEAGGDEAHTLFVSLVAPHADAGSAEARYLNAKQRPGQPSPVTLLLEVPSSWTENEILRTGGLLTYGWRHPRELPDGHPLLNTLFDFVAARHRWISSVSSKRSTLSRIVWTSRTVEEVCRLIPWMAAYTERLGVNPKPPVVPLPPEEEAQVVASIQVKPAPS